MKFSDYINIHIKVMLAKFHEDQLHTYNVREFVKKSRKSNLIQIIGNLTAKTQVVRLIWNFKCITFIRMLVYSENFMKIDYITYSKLENIFKNQEHRINSNYQEFHSQRSETKHSDGKIKIRKREIV